jgi:hypothetical protein
VERAVKLDEEQRRFVTDIVKKAAIKPSPADFDKFISRIEHSIKAFRAATARPRTTRREAHDAMRQLFFKVHEDKCDPDEIREFVDALPEPAITNIDRRAAIVIPRLFPGETADHGFRQWAKTAASQKLVQAARVLSAQGAKFVDRSRGPGKRSGMRVEPVIMGVARRAGGGIDKGGRPRDESLRALITHLAVDWLLLSGKQPIAGRSDGTPFGDLAHSVLQWEGIDYERAEYALRQYAESSKSLRGDAELLFAEKASTALRATTQAEIGRQIKRLQKDRRLRLIMVTYEPRPGFVDRRSRLCPSRRVAVRVLPRTKSRLGDLQTVRP